MGKPEDFRAIIETAEQRIGGTNKLAEAVGQRPNVISDAKAGRRGLPDEACEKLAEVAEVDFGDVIRARMRQRGSITLAFMATLAALSVVTLFVTTLLEMAQPCVFALGNSHAIYIMRYLN